MPQDSTSSRPPRQPSSLACQALFQPQLDARQTLDISGLPENALAWPELENAVTPEVAYDPLIQLYYQTFHRSHPLLIPRKALHSPLSEKIPQYILSIMRFIGAHQHHDPSLKELFRRSAYSVLFDSTPRDGFKVQGMVLLAIVDHARGAEDSATSIMQAAVNLALELGMNKAAFAAEHSGGNSILEESWRRTYWELYFVDGYLAAMRDQSAFQLFHSPADVRLPGDEELYNSGDAVILSNLTFKDLTNKWHFDDERRFPSFAYRIWAVRLLGMVMELNRSLDIDLDSQIETIDAALVASLMQLPSSQRGVYGSHSGLDEMTFQAQMTNHSPSASLDLHSQKLLRAADLLCNLATLPNPIKYRTPFFTCALAMCVVVHTVACLFVSVPEKQESIKARIQLGVGALHVLGKSWPLAKTVRQRLIAMYQELGLRCQ
ncbi:fungal specific transcription factor domain-containing protein [Aspergillus novofumigatus IBT 16806]|uniref:Putative C6 transcription factor n=1 Tax=Aspergillus novofumigatus (strain IBT 16806) TaxID=1392255 RepID=A0A2I1BZF7_ASPN1|nr:putative C6 transcription factor [Aspergillus novofumigatus IBT 16806]PKX90766.1 putative C6 transcription factor [Aspergillus novofumigatus IBT 16806]